MADQPIPNNKTSWPNIKGFENDAYGPSTRLQKVLKAALSVATAGIAEQAQKQGLSGPAVGEKIHDARVAAIALLKA